MRDSFIFYRSFQSSIKHLDPSEQLEVFHAIVAFALDQDESQMSRYAQAVWEGIKPQLIANQRKYEAGCKGGKPKANQGLTKTEPKANQDLTKGKPKANLMYNVNENENDNENENEGTNKFDAFWSAYPRKTDKVKAKRSFLRLTKTEQELAVSNIQRLYSETPAQFIPHPSTYLNGKRWEDQAIDRKPNFVKPSDDDSLPTFR